MKYLSPLWFLSSPIDEEHKYYILLDFIQSAKENPIPGEIRSLIEGLIYFNKYGLILIPGSYQTSPKEKEMMSLLEIGGLNNGEREEISKIVKRSIQILTKSPEINEILQKEIEDKIKIFNLKEELEIPQKGIAIFRNMNTNEIFPYWWKKSKITIGCQDKETVILKKIPISNDHYSVSYEFLFHESLDSIKIRNGSDLSYTVIEVSENFSPESEIFQTAKEKFIQKIQKEN